MHRTGRLEVGKLDHSQVEARSTSGATGLLIQHIAAADDNDDG
jgi:hypothetical protein